MKIALCIPVYGTCSAKFLYSILKMVSFTQNATIEWDGEIVKPEVIPLLVSCSMLVESRSRLVVEAINADADYLLWMDADHVFPEDALIRLLGRSRLVVGCNYARRFEPTSPTAAKRNIEDEESGLLWTTLEKAQANELEECDHLGFGLCLMDMRVFGALEAKAKSEGKEHFWPLFHFEIKPDGISAIGEDVYFFRKLREAGIKVFCDHGLSWEVGHCHETIMTNAHAQAQRPKWVAWNRAKMDKYKHEDEAIAAE